MLELAVWKRDFSQQSLDNFPTLQFISQWLGRRYQ